MARSTKFEIGSYEFNVLFAEYPTRTDHKTRIYVSGQDAVTEMEQPPYGAKGDNSENDRLWRQYNKLELAKMREILDHGMAALTDLDNPRIAQAPEKIKFSRHAGCSCPCSPGFVADRPLRDDEYRQIESIYITKVQPKPEPERTFTMADFDIASSN
jgi:hypothetical protein